MSVGTGTAERRGPDTLVRVLLPAVVVVATAPPALLPAAASPELLLAGGAVVLAGVGLTAAGTWRLLAAGARLGPTAGLAGAAVLLGEGVAIGGELAPPGSPGLLYGAAGGAVAGAGLVGVLVRWRHRARPGVAAPRSVRAPLAVAAVLLLALAVTRDSVPAWLVALAAVGLVVVGLPLVLAHVRAGTPRAALTVEPVVRPTGDAGEPVPEDPYATIEVDPRPAPAVPPGPSLRVLHLGGTAPERSAALHRRLAAAGHEIIVLAARAPGARDRIEHHGAGSVRWTHPVRRARTRPGRGLSYTAAAVHAARHTRADLVVEELGGPLAVPRWTARPVVALAAELPAPEPSQGWAPLLRLRWWAVRTHRSVVVRSPVAAEALRAARSRAHVAVVGDGIDPAAPWTPPRRRTDDVVVRVGKLGVDADVLRPLLYAWARAVPSSVGRLVLLDAGAHEGALRGCAAQLGLTAQVMFAQEPDGAGRHERVASARLAIVPPGTSDAAARAVALEALAVGTPVLGPDTAALREVVPATVGVLVPAAGRHDTDAAVLADALGSLHADRGRAAAAAAQGPGLARLHDLTVVAGQIEDVYLAAVARGSRGRAGRLVAH